MGAITPVDDDEGWLLASGRGFRHLSPDGSLRPIADDVSPVGTRMNDAACDPQGRLWAGTLADDHHPGGGALYRLDTTGQIDLVLTDLTISNGLGWSPDGATMYFVDSGPRAIYAFAFDGDNVLFNSEAEDVVTVDAEIGAPDGLTVDADGDLWVAVFGGGRVQHYSPDGTLRDELMVPAPRPRRARSPGHAEPSLRHDRDRELDGRATALPTVSRVGVPIRDQHGWNTHRPFRPDPCGGCTARARWLRWSCR